MIRRCLPFLVVLSVFQVCSSWQHFWKTECKPAFQGASLVVAASCWWSVSGFLLPPPPPVTIAAETTTTTMTTTSTKAISWELMNGSVSLQDPVVIGGGKTQLLRQPQLIGIGGGGAVFSFADTKRLLKVSWEGSAKSVERECKTLQLLERNQVEAAERCLGQYEYDNDADENTKKRVMILIEPYVPDAVASVDEVTNAPAQTVAVEQIARTLVQMLAANVITIDVQPLISKQTGSVIFIDMTEAQQLTPPNYSFLDKTLMSSFATETVALIPEKLLEIAAKAAWRETKLLEETRGVKLSPEALEILQEQLLDYAPNEGVAVSDRQ